MGLWHEWCLVLFSVLIFYILSFFPNIKQSVLKWPIQKSHK